MHYVQTKVNQGFYNESQEIGLNVFPFLPLGLLLLYKGTQIYFRYMCHFSYTADMGSTKMSKDWQEVEELARVVIICSWTFYL